MVDWIQKRSKNIIVIHAIRNTKVDQKLSMRPPTNRYLKICFLLKGVNIFVLHVVLPLQNIENSKNLMN
uniref:Uncharacterized protein n=1 Tax=uncultured marine thaumarchaeote KM3_41_D11 TaxID=1456145 RepID=A0A075H3Y0_9ARCH|nr:hypothetical protein [uncultured marine thaumarchaeote KM3_41_D11]